MKAFKYIFVLSAAGALCACSDLLETETKSSFDTQTVFSNYELAEGCNLRRRTTVAVTIPTWV